MARPLAGSLYQKGKRWYVSVRVGDGRPSFPLPLGMGEEAAEQRRKVLVDVATRLRRHGQDTLVQALVMQAAEADEKRLPAVLSIVEGVVNGREQAIRPVTKNDYKSMSFEEFASLWLTGELHRRFPGHVKDIDQSDNASRLRRYVFPVVGHVLLREFTQDHADLVMEQPDLPPRSQRHIAQVLARVVSLAVARGKVQAATPLPRDWLPHALKPKAMSFLYPREDALLMAAKEVPLVMRILLGFMSREGCREAEAAELTWSDLELDHEDGGGVLNLDQNKTDDPRFWALDAGTAEALRRWQKSTGSTGWVFPARLMPGARKKDHHVGVSRLADDLRSYLKLAGVTREVLFKNDDTRQQLRAHDLRASFITVHLATGKSEAWVTDRTGHKSSAMVAKYRRRARQAEELKLGMFTPLYRAIPELAEMCAEEDNG